MWGVLEFLLIGVFLFSLWRLLRFLKLRSHEKWVYLTTYERLSLGPGYPVWKKCRDFLKDTAEDLADPEIQQMKSFARTIYKYFLVSSGAGPVVLFLFFVVMLVLSNR